jgi:transcriptional regulator with XRE-family HTH domain
MVVDHQNALAWRIKQRRKQLGLSQEDLAERAGTDQTAVSRYELGKNEPGADILGALAKALDTTTDWLLGLTDIPDRPLRGQSDLSDEEKELIVILRSKTPDKRRQIVDVAKVI